MLMNSEEKISPSSKSEHKSNFFLHIKNIYSKKVIKYEFIYHLTRGRFQSFGQGGAS